MKKRVFFTFYLTWQTPQIDVFYAFVCSFDNADKNQLFRIVFELGDHGLMRYNAKKKKNLEFRSMKILS
jgi:hypothetical protein